MVFQLSESSMSLFPTVHAWEPFMKLQVKGQGRSILLVTQVNLGPAAWPVGLTFPLGTLEAGRAQIENHDAHAFHLYFTVEKTRTQRQNDITEVRPTENLHES